MMLIGDGPLRLPPYSGALPAVVVVRCVCDVRYAVFISAVVIGDGCELAKAQAEADGLLFVDARAVPFMNCECGQTLDFSPCESVELLM